MQVLMSIAEEIPTRISDAELRRRWSAVRTEMAARSIDALVMQNASDWVGGMVRWFTDIPATNGYPRTVLFFADGTMTAIEMGVFDGRREFDGSDPLHRGVTEHLTSPSFASILYTQGYDARLAADALRRRGVRTVGFVGMAALPLSLVEAVRSILPRPTNVVEASDFIDPIKAVKSPEELDLIRRAAVMQDAALADVLREIRPGMHDYEVAAIAWRGCQLRGSEQGITLGKSAPLGRASVFVGRSRQGRRIAPGDHFSLLIETNGPGAMYTEIARTMVFGKASAQLLDGFEAVRDLQVETLAHMKPGVLASDVSAVHDEAMRKRGLPPEMRLYSHGQGYDMVERPLIRRDETMTLAAGMNLAVHPGYETPGLFAVICDNYLIGPDGPGACIHATEKKIFEIG
jgi:Xaa-Pro aminopeptidase